MIEPIYQLYISQDSNGEWKITPAPSNYKITYYSKFAGYVLVGYQIENGQEAISGENLWYQGKPIASGGGQLQLLDQTSPDAKRNTNLPASDIWETIPYREIDIPSHIAIALRKTQNLRCLN